MKHRSMRLGRLAYGPGTFVYPIPWPIERGHELPSWMLNISQLNYTGNDAIYLYIGSFVPGVKGTTKPLLWACMN